MTAQPFIINSNQLDIFNIVVNSIRGDTSLKNKFPTNKFYEIEPDSLSSSFTGYPYILINIPNTSNSVFEVINHSLTTKNFNTTIIMRNDYEARNNVRNYNNKIIKQIELNESEFEESGFYDILIELIDVIPEIIDSKQIITSTFELSYNGSIER